MSNRLNRRKGDKGDKIVKRATNNSSRTKRQSKNEVKEEIS